jgi:hypothetical protein
MQRPSGRSLFFLICVLCVACGMSARARAQGQPAFDDKGVGCSFDGALASRTFTWQHTIGNGRNRLLVVGVSTALDLLPLGGLPPPRVNTVKYNGVALERIDDGSAVSPFPDSRAAVEMFQLREPLPAAGTYTVEVTLFGGVDYAVGGSVSFSDVNQLKPSGEFQSNVGNSRNPFLNDAATAPNEVLLDTVATRFDGGALQSSQTERWNGRFCFDQIHSIGAGSTKQGEFFTTTMNWTMIGGSGQAQPWAIGAVSIRPVPTKPSDFDGDSLTDVAVWRSLTGVWYIKNSSGLPAAQYQWGLAALGDVAVPGDYDGDRKTDVAIWRPQEGNWYIVGSLTHSGIIRNWGLQGDVPVPADYDGDGRTDLAVYRPQEGNWYIIDSFSGSGRVKGWGINTDRLVPADYDGDGRTDIAVWRPQEGNWYIIRSSDGLGVVQGWGMIGDRPVPGDYDGDQLADLAVYRPTEGNWYIRRSTGGAIIRNWGNATDIPVPGDYDGDGRWDVAVFRPQEGNWYVVQSGNSAAFLQLLGQAGDTPVPAAYLH